MENSQRVWMLYIIVLSLSFLTVKELSTESHFIVWAATLNQHVYYIVILISKFESKDMLPGKRGSSFVLGFMDQGLLKGCHGHHQKFASLNC